MKKLLFICILIVVFKNSYCQHSTKVPYIAYVDSVLNNVDSNSIKLTKTVITSGSESYLTNNGRVTEKTSIKNEYFSNNSKELCKVIETTEYEKTKGIVVASYYFNNGEPLKVEVYDNLLDGKTRTSTNYYYLQGPNTFIKQASHEIMGVYDGSLYSKAQMHQHLFNITK
jgi:hypothetical protein